MTYSDGARSFQLHMSDDPPVNSGTAYRRAAEGLEALEVPLNRPPAPKNTSAGSADPNQPSSSSLSRRSKKKRPRQKPKRRSRSQAVDATSDDRVAPTTVKRRKKSKSSKPSTKSSSDKHEAANRSHHATADPTECTVPLSQPRGPVRDKSDTGARPATPPRSHPAVSAGSVPKHLDPRREAMIKSEFAPMTTLQFWH